MSRSGYVEDCETIGLYRNAVHRAIKGRRGQAFLKLLRESLDAMPEKRLVTDALVRTDCRRTESNGVCAMGSVVLHKKLDAADVDPDDRHAVAALFNIAPALAAEIAYENDEGDYHHREPETPEQRWMRMRKWVEERITE